MGSDKYFDALSKYFEKKTPKYLLPSELYTDLKTLYLRSIFGRNFKKSSFFNKLENFTIVLAPQQVGFESLYTEVTNLL